MVVVEGKEDDGRGGEGRYGGGGGGGGEGEGGRGGGGGREGGGGGRGGEHARRWCLSFNVLWSVLASLSTVPANSLLKPAGEETERTLVLGVVAYTTAASDVLPM